MSQIVSYCSCTMPKSISGLILCILLVCSLYKGDCGGFFKVYYSHQKRQILHSQTNKSEGSGLAMDLLPNMPNVRPLRQFLLHLIVIAVQCQQRKIIVFSTLIFKKICDQKNTLAAEAPQTCLFPTQNSLMCTQHKLLCLLSVLREGSIFVPLAWSFAWDR